MTPRTDLFDLVHSLTPNEKRYFKLFSSVHGKSKRKMYDILFDTVAAMKDYDESILKQKLKKYPFAKHLSVAKKQLMHLILRSLWAFASEADADSAFRGTPEQVRILYKKGLHRAALHLLNKGYAEAALYERFLIQLDLLLLQEAFFEDGLLPSEIGKQIYKKQSEVLRKIENYYSCIELSKSGFFLMQTIGYARTKKDRQDYEAILGDPRLLDESFPLSHSARRSILNTQIICAPMVGDNRRAFEAGKKLYALDAGNPWFLKVKPGVHIHGILNYATTALTAKQYKAFQDAIRAAKSLLAEHARKIPKEKIRLIEMRISTCELSYMNSHNSRELSLTRIREIEDWIRTLQRKPRETETQVLQLQIAYYYLVQGMYDRSLEWTSRILQKRPAKEGQTLYIWARIIHLLIHFELRNYDYLEHEIRSAERFLEKQPGLFEFEKTLVRFFRKFVHAVTASELQRYYAQAFEELSAIEKKPEEMAAVIFIDIQAWLETKLSGKKYSEILSHRRGSRSE